MPFIPYDIQDAKDPVHGSVSSERSLILGLVKGFLQSDRLALFESSCTTRADQIACLLDQQVHFPLLQRKSQKPVKAGDAITKDKTLSKALRDAGNSAFGSGDDSAALDCYNQAVVLAPCSTDTFEGEDLAIALANRAAVFLRQEKFNLCLIDIELAKKSGYPKKLLHKLHRRHANCLSEMFRYSEARKEYQNAIDSLQFSELSANQRSQLTCELEKASNSIKNKGGLEKAIGNIMKDPSSAVPEEFAWERPDLIPNSAYPCLSCDIEVTADGNDNDCNQLKVVAKEVMSAGKVVAIEKATAYSLLNESKLTNCSYCLETVLVPVPCPGCIDIVFCSANCRDIGWNSFHKYECQADFFVNESYSDIFLAYRAVVRQPMKFYEANKTSILAHLRNSERARWANAKDPLYNILNLVTHHDVTGKDDQLVLAASACFLVHILSSTPYFRDIKSKAKLDEMSLFFGELFYYVLEATQYNTQTLSVVESWNLTKGVKTLPIGHAFNPTIALINHSCDPNAVRVNIGATTMVVLTKRVHPGSEICISYSPVFQSDAKVKRHDYLTTHYKFDCQCISCLCEWPVYTGMTKSVAKKGMSAKANEIKGVYATIHKQTIQDVQTGYFDRICEMWSSFYNETENVLQQPHKCYLRVGDEVRNSMWLKYGKRFPKIKAAVYKDHRKAEKNKNSKADSQADIAKAAMEAFASDHQNNNSDQENTVPTLPKRS